MKTFRDYINLVTQLSEAPDTVVPGGGSITTVDPNSPEGKAMIARSQAVQAGKSPDSAAPAPGQAATPTPAAAALAAAAPKTWNKGVLGKGMKGPEVSALQKKLGIPETGVYDAATIAAVQALQKKLGVAADGAYGPGTKAAHDKIPQQAATPAPVNAAAPGQPPSTAADPSKGTVAGATKAIPTSPVDPTNPSGVGAKADLTPQEIGTKAAILTAPRDAKGNTTDATGTVYKKDLDWLQRFGANTQPAASQQAATPKPAAASTTGSRSATPPLAANATTLPDGTPIERSQGNSSPEYMQQFGGQAPNQGNTTTPAAPSADTAGGASLGYRMPKRRAVPPDAGARTFESRDTQYQKELNAMLRIANLPDRGL